MSKKDSVQKRLQQVRPPRVQLTYDVERGDAIEQKELPFVVGVVGDLSGSPENPLPRLKDRKFVDVDLDNFDDVMKGAEPRTVYRVPNKISADGGEFAVELKFKGLDDFRPEAVVQQVEPLRKLFEARQRLNDLLAKLDGNDDIDVLLQDIAANTESQQKIKEATTGGNNG